jgi:predicted site-specific integrase-resolvase
MTQHPELLTQIQICRRFGISDETWRRWRQKGLTPRPVDMPGRPRWRVSDIDKFEMGRVVESGRRSFFGTAARHRREVTA